MYNNSAKPYQKATLLWDEGDLPEFGLDLPDGGPTAFQWKGVECLMNGLSGDQLTRQLISLHRVINSKDRHSLAQMVRTVADLDLTLPLRGVTALSLSLFIRQPAITKDLLTHLHRLGQLSRAINMTSVDNTHRRETPLITAARTGQSESVELLLLYKDILDLESKDGEGRTAIWNAVREEHFGIVMQLVENGARIHYDNGDLSCPLQLACKTHLLKARVRIEGRRLGVFYFMNRMRNGFINAKKAPVLQLEKSSCLIISGQANRPISRESWCQFGVCRSRPQKRALLGYLPFLWRNCRVLVEGWHQSETLVVAWRRCVAKFYPRGQGQLESNSNRPIGTSGT